MPYNIYHTTSLDNVVKTIFGFNLRSSYYYMLYSYYSISVWNYFLKLK